MTKYRIKKTYDYNYEDYEESYVYIIQHKRNLFSTWKNKDMDGRRGFTRHYHEEDIDEMNKDILDFIKEDTGQKEKKNMDDGYIYIN